MSSGRVGIDPNASGAELPSGSGRSLPFGHSPTHTRRIFFFCGGDLPPGHVEVTLPTCSMFARVAPNSPTEGYTLRPAKLCVLCKHFPLSMKWDPLGVLRGAACLLAIVLKLVPGHKLSCEISGL